MLFSRRPALRAALSVAALTALAACETDGTFDGDLRNFGNGFDTSAAARAAGPRPAADNRGVISYPNYQVAVAQRGDTVASVASRIGLGAAELATYNALAPDTPLNGGEILALPRRVAEPSPATGSPTTGPILAPGSIDVTTIASGAIDRAEASGGGAAPASAQAVGEEPVRHRVVRGETAYSIARLYGVNIRSLADWNGLPADLTVREGQYLLIPVAGAAAPVRTAAVTAPGQGSPTPTPPSASQPLPAGSPAPAATPAPAPAADMGAQKTAASAARLSMPVGGQIIRPYQKRKNDGIDIAAAAGTPVKAADAGTVAAITQDTDQVPILVIRHANNLLTVYANIDGIAVAKGAQVSRGQTIARVRAGDPAFVHFEVREGFESVDPMPYLQ